MSAAIGKSRKPLLLYLDDLQWCDPDSFEWLNALLTSSAAAGVLVLGTVRAEETGREHPFTRFLAGLRQSGIVVEIPLEPLDAEETAELARLESAKPLESGNLGEIFRATRGNPLFVVESVRAGLQSTRVHAVIAARLAQLTAASYELAGLASVIGRPFSFELLEKATDWDEASVSQALDELWRRRIIESRGASEYDFTHDRLREVACAELTLVRRRYLAPARGAGAGRGVWRPISKAGTDRSPRISNRPEWRKRPSNTTGGRLPTRASDMRIPKRRTCCGAPWHFAADSPSPSGG